MDVALITVGEELLAGDTENGNATWLAQQLTERGVTVRRVLVLPDERSIISERTRVYSEELDAVIVTGGIGGTPDDITMEAVGDAFGREMAPDELALEAVRERLAEFEEEVPELDLEVDETAEASIPEGSRPLLNTAGLAPGCVLENVYVLPGHPDEMKSMFESVADEFQGDAVAETLYTTEPEAHIVPALEEIQEQFDVSVGCYPDKEHGRNRLKLSGTDRGIVREATEWLLEEIDASETPVERDW